MKYLVTWQIDVEADGPDAAAQQAWEAMRRPDSIANVFTVRQENGVESEVDLSLPRHSPLATRH